MGYPLPSRHHLENQECLCFMTPRCLKPGCRSPCLNKGKSLIPWGLAGMRPRQPYHLQPSWSGCCAARDGTTDSCEWGEGSTRYPAPPPRHQVVRCNERAAWLTSCTFCRSATMLVLSFCSFSSVSRSFLSEVRWLSSEALARESARLW